MGSVKGGSMKGLKVLALTLLLAVVAWPAMAGGACCSKDQGVTRQVENLANGVRITITAQDPQMVAKLQSQGESCGAGCKDCPMHAQGVERKVEKIAGGVVITATSSDPKQVEALQKHAAAMGAASCQKEGAKAAGCAKGEAKASCCSKGEAKGAGCSKGSHAHAQPRS